MKATPTLLLLLSALLCVVSCKEPPRPVPERPPRLLRGSTGTIFLLAPVPDAVLVRASRVSITIPQSEGFEGRIQVAKPEDATVSITTHASFYKSQTPLKCRIDNLLVEANELLIERLPERVLTGRAIVFDGPVAISGQGGKIQARQAWVESSAMDFTRSVALCFAFDMPTPAAASEETIELELYDISDLVSSQGEKETAIADKVRAGVRPETWQLPGRSIEVTDGVLVIRATEKEHEEVAAYLKKLRLEKP